MPICRVETDQKKVALTFNCTYSAPRHAAAFGNSERKKCARHLFRFRRLGKKLSGAALYDSQRRTRYRRSVDNAGISFHPGTDAHTGKSHARIDRLTDSETTLFRFEDGNYDNSAIRLIQESGGYPVQWNINSMDWKDYGAQDILHRILNSRQLQNGSILLFHAGTVYTAQALPDLIDNLEDQGYQPVPISELIWKHSYYMDADGVQIPKTEP